ncbi:MAG TPA: hypothetical protein VMR34_02670 [Candidatus Saccharimonadales bacterium]|nr:hypothetical protein [Candidatus Saccharimonadales bacterium]
MPSPRVIHEFEVGVPPIGHDDERILSPTETRILKKLILGGDVDQATNDSLLSKFAGFMTV